MFYAEIDKDGRCFHVSPDELPVGESIIQTEEENVLGKIWNGEGWEDAPVEESTAGAEPTALTHSQTKNAPNLFVDVRECTGA